MTSGNTTLGYGIIGTGMMGVEHIENINTIAGAAVTAIADTDAGSRKEGEEAADGPVKVYDDHRDLLADESVDAVVIATPNFTHRSILDDVFEAGHHVLIEKPLCTTVADCEAVIERAAATSERFPDRVVQVGLEYRYMPPVAELVRQVKTGILGETKMVAIREHRFPFLVKIDNWNRFSANTGGTLVEKCCHFFDLMNLILDERPHRVMASGAQDVNHLDEVYDGRPSDILDNAFVIVDYPSGARAMLDLCMFAEATHNQEEISVVGDQGKLEALIPEGVVRRGLRGDHWIGGVDQEAVDTSHIAHDGLHHGSSYLEHLEFLAAIRTGQPPAVTLEDGLWSVAIGAAAHRSIELGRPVALDPELAGIHDGEDI